MQRKRAVGILAFATVAALILAGAASAQVAGLYYQEVPKDGRLYVFNTYERYQAFQKSGEMGTSITLIGRGPNGETVVAENETAMDLFLFKHNLPRTTGPPRSRRPRRPRSPRPRSAVVSTPTPPQRRTKTRARALKVPTVASASTSSASTSR